MPRHYVRKTNRGFTAELIKAAADEVIIDNKSVRSTAKKYNLCHVSLSRYLEQELYNSSPDQISPSSDITIQAPNFNVSIT